MEENNKNKNRSGEMLAGLIIILIGSFFLLNNIGINFPSWIFYWSNILILIGLFIGIKHNFRKGSSLILIIIGSFFTLKEALDQIYDFDKIGYPLLIITIGLFLIFKPKKNLNTFKTRRKDEMNNESASDPISLGDQNPYSNFNQEGNNHTVNMDYIESVNVFSGSQQIVYSKNFKGGEVTSVFGGCDVNLSQADFEGQILLEVSAIFGGVKIIVPSGWQVKQEVTAIFGGFDDKRVMRAPEESNKMLVIKGVALFGGVEIKSF